MAIKTKRLILKTPYEVTGAMVNDYYSQNRNFLKRFVPVREEMFYTEEYHRQLLQIQRVDWEKQTNCRFFICLKEESQKIIGTVALTNILKGHFLSCFFRLSVG